MADRIEGEVALDLVIQQAAPALAKEWDGGNERVAVIVQRGAALNAAGMAATLGFLSRANAVAQLRRLAAVPGPFAAASLHEMAEILEKGPPVRKVQCAIVGWGGSEIVELEPDDLRALAPRLN